MDKLLAGFIAVLVLLGIAVAFVSYQPAVEETVTPVQTRTAIADMDRANQGPARDGSQPRRPIYPWDSTELQDWMNAERARLEPLIVDEAYKTMAQDRTLWNDTSGNIGKAKFYQSTYDAYDLIYSDDLAEQDAGLYILLHTAGSGDPWAYYYLGNAIEDMELADTTIIHGMWRRAADRDFLPALVNLTSDWYDNPPQPHDQSAAYLNYGMDLGVPDNELYAAQNMAIYYIFRAADRESDGYFDKAVAKVRALNRPELARYYEGRAWQKGLERPIDGTKALVAFEEAFELGHERSLIQLARTHQTAEGNPYNRQEAVNGYMSCIEHMYHRACALNLGIVFDDRANDSVDLALAHALYRFAAEIGGPGYTLGRTNTESVGEELTFSQERQSDKYFELMMADRITEIPQLRTTRDYFDQ